MGEEQQTAGSEQPRAVEEYAAMRATIRERGTARMVLAPMVFLGWAAIAVATAAVITVAVSTLVPLMVLAAGFEAVFALHFNVERIGRYLQVFHEERGGWERVAMQFGQRFPGSGPDPLFSRTFVLATLLNALPAVLGGHPFELAIVVALHLAFLYRIHTARSLARRQRAEDLERFAALKKDGALLLGQRDGE